MTNVATSRPSKSNPNPDDDGPPLTAYPRPMLRRSTDWRSLDGVWAFALGQRAALHPDDVSFDQSIRVPFAPETPASGIGNEELFDTCWYQRTFDVPPLGDDERLMLIFEAVDDVADVWVNGQRVGSVSGAVRQQLDITPYLSAGEQTLTIRVFDDPHDMTKPRGKQDWQRQPHGIWYPRTTGLWQTVWLEPVPARRIERISTTTDLARWAIELDMQLAGPPNGLALEVTLSNDGHALAADRYAAQGDRLHRTIHLPDAGIDDVRAALLWSPEHPNLIEIDVRLVDADGRVVDQVQSYTALRSIELDGGRILLNGRPYFQRLVLVQGYWAESGLTPPTSDALRNDVELVKQLGFNGVRMHQKIESEQYLYWADQLGLLVWAELNNSYAYTPDGWLRVERQWAERIERDKSHPCVVAWVPVNESWGLPDLLRSEQQRHALASIVSLTRALDPTRPVIANDGWEMGETDLIGIHDYEGNVDRLRQRYDLQQRTWTDILAQEMPGHRRLTLAGHPYRGQPVVLSEFGGISLNLDQAANGWGYSDAANPSQFEKSYARLMHWANRVAGLAGFCYTQFTDTYQETNGLLTMTREPKVPLDQLHAATRGEALPTDRGEQPAGHV